MTLGRLRSGHHTGSAMGFIRERAQSGAFSEGAHVFGGVRPVPTFRIAAV